MPDLNWVKEIEFADVLKKHNGDLELIAEFCGIDTLIKLWENFPSMSLYISVKPLHELRRRYIQKFYDGPRDLHRLAVKLGVSDRFMYETLDMKIPPAIKAGD
jgi:hypothetical protein